MHAQQDKYYEKQWNLVDSLLTTEGMPETALSIANDIYIYANNQQDEAQVIKALIYIQHLENSITESDVNAQYKRWDTALQQSFSVAQQSIIHCQQAAILQRYYYENNWRFYQRSETVNFLKEDIATWAEHDFHETITKKYLQALQPAAELQKIKLDPFEAIIQKGNARELRPTLYDLLAYTALEYFKSGISNNNKPTYAFEMDDATALSIAPDFIKYNFTNLDTANAQLIALQLYQQLLLFHIYDEKQEAFIDADLDRITWVYQNITVDNKEALYLNALESITKDYPDTKRSSLAWYYIADVYKTKGDTYNALEDTTERYAYLTVKQIAAKQLADTDSSNEGQMRLKNLLQSIDAKQINTEAEQINLPNLPFRMKMTFKNITTAYIRIIKINKDVDINENNWEESYWQRITSIKPLRSMNQNLPDTKDFQQHSTEIKIDALSSGTYIILSSTGKQFNPTTDKLSAQYIDVSAISFISQGEDYFVLQRNSGLPMVGVEVKIDQRQWDHNKQAEQYINVANKSTDTNGHFTLPASDNNYNGYRLTFNTKNDQLISRSSVFNYTRNNEIIPNDDVQKNSRFYFYTDRSIYRPGQFVYFKAIGVTQHNLTDKPTPLQWEKSLSVVLKDVNGKAIDTLQISLNAYSSINGKFQLPKSTLTGRFTIEVVAFSGSTDFNVEEYKRPTFFVKFDTIKNDYRLGDTVLISGKVEGYAGNNIDGAGVSYTVNRNTRFIFDWIWSRWPQPRGSMQQIKHGTVKTDANGAFQISFIAQADKSVDINTEPVFDFDISASVTDNAGETRDGNSTISLGYKSMTIALSLPSEADINSFNSIGVNTTNFNGEAIPASVKLSLIQLSPPTRLIRERLWSRPDVFVMNKQDYLNNFPNDDYDDEQNPMTWKQGSEVFSSIIETATNKTINIGSKLSAGYYICIATTTDKDGHAVTNKSVIALYDAAANKMPVKKYLWEFPIKQTVATGEAGSMMISSATQNVYVVENSMLAGPGIKEKSSFAYSHITNGNKVLSLEMPALAKAGGISYAFVKHNRFYSGGMKVNVPDSSHDLKMEISSYRNKTVPGNKEQWSITIKDDKNNASTAELLTAMYDASLDAFAPHSWQKPALWPTYSVANYFTDHGNFAIANASENYIDNPGETFNTSYDRLSTEAEAFIYEDGYYGGTGGARRQSRDKGFLLADAAVAPAANLEGDGNVESKEKFTPPKIVKDEEVNDQKDIAEGNEIPSPANVSLRKNFNETAFFLPEVYANENGDYRFEFTMPDALTQWKWMLLAHNKDLAFAGKEVTTITQKELMVQPQLPRFFREGDRMDLSIKISNLSDTVFTGTAVLSLLDAITNEPVDGLFQNSIPNQYFTVEAGQSSALKFPVVIPYNNTRPVTIKVYGIVPGSSTELTYSDGEENTLPVLSNRMLVTESLPFYVRGNASKTYSFDKLRNNESPSLTHQSLTIEYTTNPAWYVVQAIPYVNESELMCAEAIFNNLYINTLAQYILKNNPEIKDVIHKWKSSDTAALQSNLEKNESLKQILLQETPWVMEALQESAQKKRIANLLSDENLNQAIENLPARLKEWQLPNGAFAWMKGGYEDRYMTQYIMTGIGKLFALQTLDKPTTDALQEIANAAIVYLDNQVQKDYDNLIKYKSDLSKNNTGSTQIQYLYMRSFFKDKPNAAKAFSYYYDQCKTYWAQQSIYMKAMSAFILYRGNDKEWTLKKIIPSLVENAIKNPETGMYFKNSRNGYYWYENPIEQQSLVISLFNEMYQQEQNINYLQYANDMQAWLIMNKQTNSWKTTRATADACYALTSSPVALLQVKASVDISSGSKKIATAGEVGTGYFKQRFDGPEVSNDLGTIKINIQNSIANKSVATPSFGAAYWQYFEDLNMITPAETPLSLKKQLFIEKNTDAGIRIETLQEGETVHIGDKVIVRIELRSDRDMEYLLLKDMRAAALEPINVISNYKWQDGFGYYESVKDASTDFFINFLPKGTYVFEYALRASQSGTFSNGTATIQCYYAPEFTSHSAGLNVNVNE